MNIWVTRHGQTDLNKSHLMQGISDHPLNARGLEQARAVRSRIGEVTFDAVYASPLDRAITTATIVGNVPRESIQVDERIIEMDFGRYEGRPYTGMGPAMTLYWVLPELFPAPKTVESVASMRARTTSFLKELEDKDYDNVLIVCHGGVIRGICGYLEDRSNGIKWRPKPKNCEVRVYRSENGQHSFVKDILADV
ncbi:MAG: histidine phosphatase family protein [Lachnospiraceae bacterium]|nr:histidine phosphatase family protein [Lachnospiraceae bacterium]